MACEFLMTLARHPLQGSCGTSGGEAPLEPNQFKQRECQRQVLLLGKLPERWIIYKLCGTHGWSGESGVRSNLYLPVGGKTIVFKQA